MLQLNKAILENLIKDKYIMMSKHPLWDLYILNYTKTVQFEKLWNEYTSICRGLVIDKDLNIIARPFKKFFNMEEHKPNEIPYDLPFEVYQKMDGSLGIIFFYNNQWNIATRGSFNSEQAARGKIILNAKLKSGKLNLDERFTYLVEIIYPENRIVVNYKGLSDLILLGIIETKTGEELPYETFEATGFTPVIKFPFNDNNISKIRELFENNTDEGVIVKFSNGFRMKIKWAEYCRLHSIVTNVSTKIVWEYLRDDKPFDELLENIPDEFYNWIENVKNDLICNYKKIEQESLNKFNELYFEKNLITKKDFALEALKYEYRSILFNLFDKKNYNHIIWKMVEPEYAKPFGGD